MTTKCLCIIFSILGLLGMYVWLAKKLRKKKIKTRTKFVIACVINAEILMAYMIICSFFHFDFPPDTFIIGWFSLWTAELALLYGIKIKSKNDDDEGGL